MTPDLIVKLIVLGPLLGAAIAGLSGRRIGDIASQTVTTGLLLLSAALSWYVFSQVSAGAWSPFIAHFAPFIQVGKFQSDWSVRIDTLSAVMLIVVTTVSSLVHIYSWGYMADDDSRPRFFAYLSLFTFAMLALVTAADFMQLFFGWEGVGEEVEHGALVGADAGGNEHVAELRAGRIGDHPLDVVLRQADGGGEQGGDRADQRNDPLGDRGVLEHRRQQADHVDAGGDHGRGVNQGRDRGRTLHGVG